MNIIIAVAPFISISGSYTAKLNNELVATVVPIGEHDRDYDGKSAYRICWINGFCSYVKTLDNLKTFIETRLEENPKLAV